MKKVVFLLLFALLCTLSYSQTTINTNGAPNTFSRYLGAYAPDQYLRIPKRTLNIVFHLVDSAGNMQVDPIDSTLAYYSGRQWRKLVHQTQLNAMLGAYLPTSTYNWGTLPGIPLTFPPVTHTHSISDVTSLQAVLDQKLNITDTTNKWYPRNHNPSGFLTSVPAQSFTSLTGKPTTLSGYGIVDAYPLTGNPAGFLISETDPTIPSYSKSLTAFSVIKSSTDGLYEPIFSKNTAFNKNFGTSAGTITQGDDSRINNGQTAFGWGNHSGLYPLLNGTGATGTWGINVTGNSATATTLQTSRTINGQAFNGSANITIPGSAVTSIPNASLTSSSLTINGITVSLGTSATITASPQVGTPNAGNTVTMGTAFQPRSGGPCHIVINGSLSGIVGLLETITVATSTTQNGTYTNVTSDILLVSLLGQTVDRSIASFPIASGNWVKVTRSGSAATATFTKIDL